MDKLRRLRAYIEIYYATATQHQTARAAREWMEADVPPEAAGAWASLGYLPGEAAPLIAAGVHSGDGCRNGGSGRRPGVRKWPLSRYQPTSRVAM
jgi:hypothetical protein